MFNYTVGRILAGRYYQGDNAHMKDAFSYVYDTGVARLDAPPTKLTSLLRHRVRTQMFGTLHDPSTYLASELYKMSNCTGG